ncbi:MAG: hypothetical protein AAF823_05260 [Planctomycetota bacterium]
MTQATAHPPADAQGFIDLLTRQRDLYRRLHDLAAAQDQTLSEQGASAMLGVLSQRQVLIDALARLNADIEPYRARWQSFTASLSEDDREAVRERVGEIDGLLAGVLAHDEKAKQSLTDLQKGVGNELNRVAAGTRARSAYGQGPASSPSNPRFADQQG